MKAFQRTANIQRGGINPSDATLTDFSGGLKIIENQNALSSKFSVVQKNMFSEEDNSIAVRFGTKQFSDAIAGKTLNATYFKGHIIIIKNTGKVYKINGAGVSTQIFDLWTNGITLADITDFRGELILTNGDDKPLLVKADLTCNWLQDIPTGSNIFTPITKFVTTVSNYTVMAGFNNTDEIFISATGTSGTWPGDPAPNDSLSIRVGAYSGKSGKDIVAIAGFRTYLLIFFQESLIVFELGIFDGTVHKPKFIDAFNDLGTINHKTLMTTDKDVIFLNRNAIYSAQKNVFGGSLESSTINENLGVDFVKATAQISLDDLDSFIIVDQLTKTLFVSLKIVGGPAKVFAATYKKDFTKFSWATCTNWAFDCAVVTQTKRLFFFANTFIWQYGNPVFAGENYSADFITTLSPEGESINFDWEMPWTDANNRNITKKLLNVSLDTLGTSKFNLYCFVDGFYKKADGTTYDPALKISFVAGDGTGYGTPNKGYGGGRKANDERFFGMPVKFKIIKLRFFGSTKEALKITSVSLIYGKGNYKR